jgi:protein-S-isoprenylcysteine O-methyltransferase Ste14
MNLMLTETLLRLAGGLLAYTTLVVVLYGVWRGTRRPTGRITGISETWLRSPWFYLVSTTLFIWAGYLLWKPLPLYISPSIRAWMLAVGSLLLFPGLSLVLWGRLALGKNYFVSSGFGAQLFAGHRLVTSGPFSIVRHPMYLGLILAAFGSLLIYFTMTSLIFTCFAPFVLVRIHHEEKALAAEFGEEWQVYSHRVAAFWPKFYK